MIIRSNRITINRVRKPSPDNVNDELQWFFDSLGVLGNRDKDKSCFRTVIVLLRSIKRDGMTSDEISEKISEQHKINIDNTSLQSITPIKEIGKYNIKIALGKSNCQITLKVKSETS